MHSRHVREIVDASREGGASLNVLSGLTAGNFSAFWLAELSSAALMAIAYGVSQSRRRRSRRRAMLLPAHAPAVAVFAFGLVAFGFLGMGPVTIAVDCYGPVTDNAQSVYELSLIEQVPDIDAELKRDFNIDADFEQAKLLLEENDGAGNTFKATAKPVLIGTAVVGATTLIFSIIMMLTNGMTEHGRDRESVDPARSIPAGPDHRAARSFTGSPAPACQAVVTGAYRAVEFIKRQHEA